MTAEEIRTRVAESRQAQGLEPTVTAADVLRAIAALLRAEASR